MSQNIHSKSISISWKLVFHEEHLVATRHLSPDRNKKCWLFHTIHLIIVFLHNLPCFRQKMMHVLSTISNPFHLMWHGICDKLINGLTLDSTCQLDICNLCVPLFPCGRNWQPHLLSNLYNIYVDLERPTI
jgi:hypothetical protein